MVSLFNWNCSYFNDSDKNWHYGKLFLYPEGLIFIEPKSNHSMQLPFNLIRGIKKGMSSYIYSCLLIELKLSCLYFSSFNNRDNVFNIIMHFWNYLLETDDSKLQHILQKPGDELLKIALNMQSTLSNAAVSLHNQGKQLNQTTERLNHMHNDLAVSTRVTNDLESWFGALRFKESFVEKKIISPRNDGLVCYAEKHVFKVLIGKNPQESHFPGCLVFVDKNLEVKNEKSDILFSSSVSSISQINIHSPYDATFVKHLLGKPDQKVHLVSSSFPGIICMLEKSYLYPTKYDDPKPADSSGPNEEDIRELLLQFSSLKKDQYKVERENIDDTGLQLSSILTSVKSMAVEISLEQDAQLKQVDAIAASVDKASCIVKNNEWKVKKMT